MGNSGTKSIKEIFVNTEQRYADTPLLTVLAVVKAQRVYGNWNFKRRKNNTSNTNLACIHNYTNVLNNYECFEAAFHKKNKLKFLRCTLLDRKICYPNQILFNILNFRNLKS